MSEFPCDLRALRSSPMLRGAALLCLGLVVPLSLEAAVQDDQEPSYAIVGASVLTMDERGLLENQTIVVRSGRIAEIGHVDSVALGGVSEIDARGRYVMPGLVDAHIHLRESTEADLVRYLRAGVTTARDMNGRPHLLEWRARIARGELFGPTLYIASPSIGNISSPRQGYPTPETAEEGRAAVRRFHAAGYDWIKVYSFLPAAGFDGVVEEAERLGMPVGGHIPLAVGRDALESGIRSIEHLTEYNDFALGESPEDAGLRTIFHAAAIDAAKLAEVARTTAERGIWNVPSITWFDRNMPTGRVREQWRSIEDRRQGRQNRRRIVGELHRAGASLALGTDSDGLSEHLSPSVVVEELQAMSEAGLTPLEVLEVATVGGAELLGGLDEFGTLATGKRADLLVLFCDPREDLLCLADIEWVMARGRLPVYEVDRERQEEAEGAR